MAASAVQFVKVIEQYPCLYNNRLPDHSRKEVTDKVWSEVAQRTNTSVSDCQTKWRNIRNGFVRSLKPNTSGSSTKQKKLYYLHEELQFVLPFVKAVIYTSETRNAPTPPHTVSIEDTDSSASSNEEANCTSETSCYEPVVVNDPTKPKLRKVTNEVNETFVEWLKKKEYENDNPRKMFLLSLLPDVDNLTEEQMRKFRIKVLLLLEEIQTGSSQQTECVGANIKLENFDPLYK